MFRESNWQRALEVYLEGLQVLPQRPSSVKDLKGKGKAKSDVQDGLDGGGDDDDEETVDEPASSSSPTATPAVETPIVMDTSPLALMEQQCSVVRSILNSNIAACHVKLV